MSIIYHMLFAIQNIENYEKSFLKSDKIYITLYLYTKYR